MTTRERYQELRGLAAKHIKDRANKDYGRDGYVWGPHAMEAACDGEIAGCMYFGAKPNFELYQFGDGGADLWVLLAIGGGRSKFVKINFKGVWKRPKYLLVGALDPTKNRKQDYIVQPDTIYAQAYRHPGQGKNENDISLGPWPLNGWMGGKRVATFKTGYFMDNPRLNHQVPSLEPNLLHPMELLRARYLHRWRHTGEDEQAAVYCTDQSYQEIVG